MDSVLSTGAGFGSGVAIVGLTGNLLSGDDIFRGLRSESDGFLGESVFESGEVRLFSIFKGEADSRSIGLLAVNREILVGDMFSRSAESETFATKGELGGPSLSLSPDAWEMLVASKSFWREISRGCAALSAMSLFSDSGAAMPIIDSNRFQRRCMIELARISIFVGRQLVDLLILSTVGNEVVGDGRLFTKHCRTGLA
jgi:hypothetical protein